MSKYTSLKEAILGFGLTLTLAVNASDGFAFTAEPVAPPATNAAPQITSPGSPAVPHYTDPLAPADKKRQDIEVKIPGIGYVGTIPKIDFGLELLYGSKNTQQDTNGLAVEQGPPVDQHGQEDVQVKGTFTHKF